MRDKTMKRDINRTVAEEMNAAYGILLGETY